jgi:hypothetical protein
MSIVISKDNLKDIISSPSSSKNIILISNKPKSSSREKKWMEQMLPILSTSIMQQNYPIDLIKEIIYYSYEYFECFYRTSNVQTDIKLLLVDGVITDKNLNRVLASRTLTSIDPIKNERLSYHCNIVRIGHLLMMVSSHKSDIPYVSNVNMDIYSRATEKSDIPYVSNVNMDIYNRATEKWYVSAEMVSISNYSNIQTIVIRDDRYDHSNLYLFETVYGTDQDRNFTVHVYDSVLDKWRKGPSFSTYGYRLCFTNIKSSIYSFGCGAEFMIILDTSTNFYSKCFKEKRVKINYVNGAEGCWGLQSWCFTKDDAHIIIIIVNDGELHPMTWICEYTISTSTMVKLPWVLPIIDHYWRFGGWYDSLTKSVYISFGEREPKDGEPRTTTTSVWVWHMETDHMIVNDEGQSDNDDDDDDDDDSCWKPVPGHVPLPRDADFNFCS